MLRERHLKELLSDKGRTNFSRGREHQGPPKPPSPARTISMIIKDDTSINNVKFTTTHKLKRSITRERYDKLEKSIIFDKSDADGLVFPNHDTLVITLQTLDTNVKCIMIDDGSGACIIHPRVLTKMKLEDRIVSHCITLTGFNNAVEWTSGEITLPILSGDVTLETTFHIMNQDNAHTYMSGIPKEITTHKLNVDPYHPQVKQVSRKFNSAINDAVRDKVEKMLENGSIRESKYPKWVANVVMVKKKNGKWRMCADFTDLNKACPKDSFSLPYIDQLIDATAGHELLSFLDAYSGYNQILME
ncbi:uncharacterized protein [Nicotiana tomentosiformis]|uniref:uncharacterized protein n=1 Tax=Nicotiana tomentosiformis TaxID=4098 RepID=UPI00388C87F4